MREIIIHYFCKASDSLDGNRYQLRGIDGGEAGGGGDEESTRNRKSKVKRRERWKRTGRAGGIQHIKMDVKRKTR